MFSRRQNHDSALHSAVEFGHGNIVSALVQKYHADPTKRNKVSFSISYIMLRAVLLEEIHSLV